VRPTNGVSSSERKKKILQLEALLTPNAWLLTNRIEPNMLAQLSAEKQPFSQQRAVTPNWMGVIALQELINTFLLRAEKPTEDIIKWCLFLLNMKEIRYKKLSSGFLNMKMWVV